MATQNKEQEKKRLEEIARSYSFLSSFIESAEPTQYPAPGKNQGLNHRIEVALGKVKEKFAKKAGIDDAEPLKIMTYGQLVRKTAHQILENNFPLREEDMEDYAFASQDRNESFMKLRYDLSSLNSALHMYLKDKGASNRELWDLEAKPQAVYARLRKQGVEPNDAVARINERLPHINTTYPTIDDVEGSWKALGNAINSLESEGSRPDLVQTAIKAGHDYMDTMRRLHDFNKY